MTILGRLASCFRNETGLPKANPVRNPQSSEFEVDAWSLSEFVLQKLVPIVGVHPFPLHELMLLSATVCRVRPRMIYEWGTHIGKSARVFYETVIHYDIDCDIHSVDLPDNIAHVEHPSLERGKFVRGLKRVHLHQGDGVETSLRMWRDSESPEPVIFFVDGDHSVDTVYRELSAIVDQVPRPTVLLHDTFYQSSESKYNVGPHKAIERVLGEHRGRFKRIDSDLGLPGMALLYPARTTSPY
jgi:cephalosporin hydroxylase